MIPDRTILKYAVPVCLAQTVCQYFLFYIGVAHTSGVKGAIINALGTFFSIFLAAFVFRLEKLNSVKTLGSVLGFVGVLLIVTSGQSIGGEAASFAGEGCMVIAALASSLAGCFIKIFGQKENPVVLSGWHFLAAKVHKSSEQTQKPLEIKNTKEQICKKYV